MTFIIFVAAFVTLACLGLPLIVIGVFAALCREKAADLPRAAETAREGRPGHPDGSIPGPLGVT